MKAKVAAFVVATAAVALAGCAMQSSTGWTTLVDGTRGLDNFNRVGEANWSAKDGAIEATAGGKDPAYLVTKNSYRDFTLRVEFWASDDANSGVFFRCQNPASINDENCYEANIFDQRPDQTHAHRRDRQGGGGHAAGTQGGRQVERLRDHRQGHAARAGPERHARPSTCATPSLRAGPSRSSGAAGPSSSARSRSRPSDALMPQYLLALAAGAAGVLAFAPFAHAARQRRRARGAVPAVERQRHARRRAAGIGFAFGLGLFGVGRILGVHRARDVRRHAGAGRRDRHGRLRRAPRAVARARGLARRARGARRKDSRASSPSAGAFVLCEWLRGWVFTGFPWLTMGYAEILAGGPLPLAGFAPVGGVFLVSLAVATCAACVTGIMLAVAESQPRRVVGVPRHRRARDVRRRRVAARRVDATRGPARRGLAPAGQRLAGGQVRSRVPAAQLRALRQPRAREQGAHRRDAGKRVSAIRGRDPGRGVPAPRRRRARPRRQHPDRPVRRRAAARERRRRAHLQQRGDAWATRRRSSIASVTWCRSASRFR